jgi:hypothetical protein
MSVELGQFVDDLDGISITADAREETGTLLQR